MTECETTRCLAQTILGTHEKTRGFAQPRLGEREKHEVFLDLAQGLEFLVRKNTVFSRNAAKLRGIGPSIRIWV